MRFCPYGARLYHALKNGYPLDNSIYLFCGNNAWNKSQAFVNMRTLLLCLPPFLSANEFYWPVQDADVLIFDTGNSDIPYIEEIAHVLFEHGAKVIRANMRDDSLIVYK